MTEHNDFKEKVIKLSEHWTSHTHLVRQEDNAQLGNNEMRYLEQFGIYNEGDPNQQFIAVHFEPDDAIPRIKDTPLEDIHIDDCLMSRPVVYDFMKNDWIERKDLMHIISDDDFYFVDDPTEFIDKLSAAMNDRGVFLAYDNTQEDEYDPDEPPSVDYG